MTPIEQLISLRDEMLKYRDWVPITRDEDITAWLTKQVAVLDTIIDDLKEATK